MHAADVGWFAGINAQLIRNLGLNITLSYRTDTGALASSYYASGQPFLFYWWSPERLVTNTRATRLALPKYNRTQWKTANREDCCSSTSTISSAWDSTNLFKIARVDLSLKSPVLALLVERFSVREDQLADMLAMLPVNSSSSDNPFTEQIACEWLKKNRIAWHNWKPPR